MYVTNYVNEAKCKTCLLTELSLFINMGGGTGWHTAQNRVLSFSLLQVEQHSPSTATSSKITLEHTRRDKSTTHAYFQ